MADGEERAPGTLRRGGAKEPSRGRDQARKNTISTKTIDEGNQSTVTEADQGCAGHWAAFWAGQVSSLSNCGHGFLCVYVCKISLTFTLNTHNVM